MKKRRLFTTCLIFLLFMSLIGCGELNDQVKSSVVETINNIDETSRTVTGSGVSESSVSENNDEKEADVTSTPAPISTYSPLPLREFRYNEGKLTGYVDYEYNNEDYSLIVGYNQKGDLILREIKGEIKLTIIPFTPLLLKRIV